MPVGASGQDIDELAKPEGKEMSLAFAGEHTHRTPRGRVLCCGLVRKTPVKQRFIDPGLTSQMFLFKDGERIAKLFKDLGTSHSASQVKFDIQTVTLGCCRDNSVALAQPRFYSTVHGAWWSGVKLAEMLVAKYEGGPRIEG